MRQFLFHFRHAFSIWRCNFDWSRRKFDYYGWISWSTAWEATDHLKRETKEKP